MNIYFAYFDIFWTSQIFGIFGIWAKFGHLETHMTKSAGYQPNMPHIGYECHILIRNLGPVILVGVAP